MNPPWATDRNYFDFLIGTPREASAVEAARVQPAHPNAPAHDAFTRLLSRLEPDPEALWTEVRPLVRQLDGILIADDTVLDKPYAGRWGWSGRSGPANTSGCSAASTWSPSPGVTSTPCTRPTTAWSIRPRCPSGPRTSTSGRCSPPPRPAGSPRSVCFDSWYSSKENLKAVRGHGWHFLTQPHPNRNVNLDCTGNKPVREQLIAATGTVVHVEGFGLVKAFRIVAPNGNTEHWITNDLGMDELARQTYAERAWAIEEYHRGLKQCTEVER